MSNSTDDEEMVPPLQMDSDSQLQGRTDGDHHAERVHWLYQLINMQRLFHSFEKCYPAAGLPQQYKDVTMAPRDMIPPRSLNGVDVYTLRGGFPPDVLRCTPDAFQSRVSCVTPQSIKSNIATINECTTQSGSPDVTANLIPRSRITSASQESQVQSKMPAMIKQDPMPSTSSMLLYNANYQAHKPLQGRSLFTPMSAAGQLKDDSSDTDAKTTQGSPAALSKKSLPPCPDLMAWPGLHSHQTPSEVELTNAWLDLHSVLDLSTHNANCYKPYSSAIPSCSSSKKEHRRSVVTAPELQQHSPCISQDTSLTKHTHLDRNSDQFQSPNTWSESNSFPSFNVDSAVDGNETTSDKSETILTSHNVKESLEKCHEGGGRVVESQVKLERDDMEYSSPWSLDSFPQAFTSESRNSVPVELLGLTQSSPPKTPVSKSISKLSTSVETSLSTTTPTHVLESLSNEQSLNDASHSSGETMQDSGDQEKVPEEDTDDVDFKVQPPPDNKCPICEDTVSGYHYGMYSCESCKGFFKRTIHSKRFEKLKCASGGTCVITLKSRKLCASCRFQKCLSLGMKFEAIRSDRQRGGRSLYVGSSEQRRLSKLEEKMQSQLKSSPPKKRKCRESIPCKDKSLEQPNKTPTDSKNVTLSQQLSKVEAPQEECSKVKSKSHHVAPLPTIIEHLMDKENGFAQQSFADCCLCILREEKNLIVTLSHIINHKLLPLIRWVQGLPLYRELTIEDQISLLHRSMLSLLCLNLIFYCLDNMGRLLMPQNKVIDLAYFSVSKFNQLVPKITHIGRQLHNSGLDMKTFVCLKLILLLNSDTPMLQNRQQVRSYQESIQNTLFAYISKAEPKNRRTCGNLMLSLAAIERVSQQVTQETVCNLEVVDEMFRRGIDVSPEKPWIQCFSLSRHATMLSDHWFFLVLTTPTRYLLYDAREVDLKRLQRLQNKAARLVFACGREQNSSDLLRSLHWLPVRERIKYKILLYVYKSIHGQAPNYLTENLILYNTGNYEGRMRLRSSSDVTRLVVPRSHKKAGDSLFFVAAPKLWNQLSRDIRGAASTPVFKRSLKTFLFPRE